MIAFNQLYSNFEIILNMLNINTEMFDGMRTVTLESPTSQLKANDFEITNQINSKFKRRQRTTSPF